MGVINTIIKQVSDYEGTSASELPPLASTIDPVVIETFIESVDNDGDFINFSYCGYYVSVFGSGEVVIDGEDTFD